MSREPSDVVHNHPHSVASPFKETTSKHRKRQSFAVGTVGNDVRTQSSCTQNLSIIIVLVLFVTLLPRLNHLELSVFHYSTFIS